MPQKGTSNAEQERISKENRKKIFYKEESARKELGEYCMDRMYNITIIPTILSFSFIGYCLYIFFYKICYLQDYPKVDNEIMLSGIAVTILVYSIYTINKRWDERLEVKKNIQNKQTSENEHVKRIKYSHHQIYTNNGFLYRYYIISRLIFRLITLATLGIIFLIIYRILDF